jgi:hypothetical protein
MTTARAAAFQLLLLVIALALLASVLAGWSWD